MYESPINLITYNIYQQIMQQQEEEICKAVLHYVPNVDKAELIRALQYDRDQYSKGYEDGHRDAVKHGKWIETVWRSKCSLCGFLVDTPLNPYNYCPNCGADMRGESDEKK